MKWIQMHLLAEESDGQEWNSIHSWRYNGARLYPKHPLYLSRPDTERFSLFGAFSDLWHDSLPGERPPLPEPGEIPNDMAADTRKYLEQFEPLGASSPSIFDVLNYPWESPIHRVHMLSDVAYNHWEVTKIVPAGAADDPVETRTNEVTYTLDAEDLWGQEWLQRTIPRLRTLNDNTTRLICFFTEVHNE